MLYDYKKSISQMSFDDYWEKLKETGWLDWVPKDKVRDLFDRTQNQFERFPNSTYIGLVTTAFDAECIYDSEPDGLSYHSMLLFLSEYSSGHFMPEDISEEFDIQNEIHKVLFHVGGRLYECEVWWATDWFDPVVIDLINTALADSGQELQFIELPTTDQIMKLSFIPENVFVKAIDASLIPPPMYHFYKDSQRFSLDAYLAKYAEARAKTSDWKELREVDIQRSRR